MSKTIYVVQGTTGEYSDRTDWMVRAYNTMEEAKEEVTRLSDLLRSLGGYKFNMDWDERDVISEVMRLTDHRFHMDYGGTMWFVNECELVE
jgi:hypothetical protein